jgi:hypothetical protein
MSLPAALFLAHRLSNVTPMSSGPELLITVTFGYFALIASRNCR